MKKISFDRLKLRYQVTILISMSILLLFIIQFIFYIKFVDTMKLQAKDYTTSTMSQIKGNIDVSTKSLEDISYILAYSNWVQKYLVEDSVSDKVELNIFVSGVINYITSTNTDVVDICLVKNDESYSSFMSNLSFNEYNSLVKNKNFPSKAAALPAFLTFSSPEDNNLFYYLIRPIYQSEYGSPLNNRIGYIILKCKTNNVMSIIDHANTTSGSQFFIVDESNKIILSRDIKSVGSYYSKINLKDSGGHIYQNVFMENTKWRIIGSVSVAHIYNKQNIYISSFLSMVLIMSFLLIAIGLILNKNLTIPVSRVVSFTNGLNEENIHKRLKIKGNSEIDFIGSDINKMLDKIEDFTQANMQTQQELYESKLIQKQSELSTLQSQINPHFLYNTLECIRSISIANNIKEIVEISVAMAEIFRYSIRGGNYVTLKEELNIIKQYFNIIGIRFNGRFKLELDIEEAMLNKKIIKMILQPIVENAVYHGLEPKIGEGKVNITGRLKDNIMIFFISDNGKGIKFEALEKLRAKLELPDTSELLDKKSRNGIGLYNIHKRIKLNLGAQYGLQIDSVEEEGTRITLKLTCEE
ncbi:MAG TPA: histidine kinase [Clostridiaceae bacterium]